MTASTHRRARVFDSDRFERHFTKTLASPEIVVPGAPARRVFMRRYLDSRLGQEMLMRAVVEEKADEILVIAERRYLHEQKKEG